MAYKLPQLNDSFEYALSRALFMESAIMALSLEPQMNMNNMKENHEFFLTRWVAVWIFSLHRVRV